MDVFGIGLLEIGMILLVALIAVGPKRLPVLAQQLGILLTQARRQMAEAKQTLLTEIEPVKDAAEAARDQMKGVADQRDNSTPSGPPEDSDSSSKA